MHTDYPHSAIATVGFFDGVHKGHQYLIEQLRLLSAERREQNAVITFAQHPRQVLNQGFQADLLTLRSEKQALLKALNVDRCIVLDFTPELAKLSAKQFMQILRQDYCIDGLLVGYDHRFGHDRNEGFSHYEEYGRELGMSVFQAKPYMLENGNPISSSSIRKMLRAGQIREANACLGYSYTLSGKVVVGHQVGRTIGFPTANIQVDKDKLLPTDGVYAVKVKIADKTFGGMLSIGKRPTMDNGSDRSIEVHIFDFQQDLYGREITLSLIQRTREEIKFNTQEALISQLHKDKSQIIQILKETES